ncbi:MAG TPA: hypothetical protein VK978_00680 [Candidatus Saccharimonadales bacterium]|nr:hypothetical protein [Candidatus Saccharimonadales bacterium]
MFIQMILDHLPRRWKAAAALLVLMAGISTAFSALTSILLGGSGLDWLRFLGGLIIGLLATVYFYKEQHHAARGQTAEQIQADTFDQYGKDLKVQQAAKSMEAWHLNDNPSQTPPDNRLHR